MTRDDLKPKEICNNCFIKLNEFSDFIHNCTLTNAKFEELLLFETPQNQFMPHFQKWPDNVETNEKSVIVTSKDNQECAELIMLHQYKDNILDNLQTTNLSDIVDIVNYAPEPNIKSCNLKSSSCTESGHSVLRHSGMLQKLNEASYELEERFDRKRQQQCSYYSNGNIKILSDYSSLSEMNIGDYGGNFSSNSDVGQVFDVSNRNG